VHDEYTMKPYVEGVEPWDRFQLAYKLGGRCAIAEDLEELEYLPEEWGYPGEAARLAVEEFNRQCQEGRPDPPRKLDAAPLVDPPYYVTEVIPAITMTFSGLLIDDRARMLDGSYPPIPGLLAAGGTYYRAYAGGAATALIFGLQAASTALESAAPSESSSRGHGRSWRRSDHRRSCDQRRKWVRLYGIHMLNRRSGSGSVIDQR
jgi:FAD binding domain